MAEPEPRPASIADLDDETLRRIFGPLSAADTAAGRAVGRQWQRALGDPLLWFRLCQRDYGLGAFPAYGLPACLPDAFCPGMHYRRSYALWQASFAEFSDCKPLLRRAVVVWKRIRRWLTQHHPDVLPSLSRSCTAAALEDAALHCWLPLPLPKEFQALWRVCDGQWLAHDAALDAWLASRGPDTGAPAPIGPSTRHGLLGGYCLTPDSTALLPGCTALLPAGRMACWTRHAQSVGRQVPEGVAVFAAAWPDKFLGVDCVDGRVLCLTNFGPRPLCPQGTTVLDWLEAFAGRLEAGGLAAAAQPLALTGEADGWPDTRALCLLPRTQAAGLRQRTSSGVCVRMAAVWAPEYSAWLPHWGASGRALYVYSVSLRLLPAEEQEAQGQRPRAAVQLTAMRTEYQDTAGRPLEPAQEMLLWPETVRELLPAWRDANMPTLLTAGGEQVTVQKVAYTKQRASLRECFTFEEAGLGAHAGACFDVWGPSLDLWIPDWAF